MRIDVCQTDINYILYDARGSYDKRTDDGISTRYYDICTVVLTHNMQNIESTVLSSRPFINNKVD